MSDNPTAQELRLVQALTKVRRLEAALEGAMLERDTAIREFAMMGHGRKARAAKLTGLTKGRISQLTGST